jgi:uncharacterized RDD family membrane protein YckC
MIGLAAWSLAAMWLVIAVLGFRREADLVPDLAPVALVSLGASLLAVALHVVYHTVLVGGCGQTVGKMLLGVAVVRRDGSPAGYGRALLRCMGGGLTVLTLGLGRLLVFANRERRGLSDLVAGTRAISI